MVVLPVPATPYGCAGKVNLPGKWAGPATWEGYSR